MAFTLRTRFCRGVGVILFIGIVFAVMGFGFMTGYMVSNKDFFYYYGITLIVAGVILMICSITYIVASESPEVKNKIDRCWQRFVECATDGNCLSVGAFMVIGALIVLTGLGFMVAYMMSDKHYYFYAGLAVIGLGGVLAIGALINVVLCNSPEFLTKISHGWRRFTGWTSQRKFFLSICLIFATGLVTEIVYIAKFVDPPNYNQTAKALNIAGIVLMITAAVLLTVRDFIRDCIPWLPTRVSDFVTNTVGAFSKRLQYGCCFPTLNFRENAQSKIALCCVGVRARIRILGYAVCCCVKNSQLVPLLKGSINSDTQPAVKVQTYTVQPSAPSNHAADLV